MWRLRPNRTALPTRWLLAMPAGALALQFDQKILGKLSGPPYRTVLAILAGGDRGRCRVVDPRKDTPDRILGVGADEWALVAGERVLAKRVRLPRPATAGPRLLAGLRRLLAAPDRGLVSAGSEHAPPGLAVLAMRMRVDALTGASAGQARDRPRPALNVETTAPRAECPRSGTPACRRCCA